MSKVYFTSDLHLGHRGIVETHSRTHFADVPEHDQHIIDMMKTANKRDIIWVLGDVAWNDESLKRLAEVEATMFLVLGNHDNGLDRILINSLFDKVYGVGYKYGMVMTHIPIHPSEFYRWKLNIHGHLHDKNIDDPRYMNVCPEVNNYKLVELGTLKEIANGQEKTTC